MKTQAHNLPTRRYGGVFLRLCVYACFFLSGATSLLFEIIWSRRFVTIFGNTSYAVSIVLCAYMAGLGIGGLFGGRLADKIKQRAAFFGIIAAIIGAYALAIPSMLDWLGKIVPTLSSLSSNSLLTGTLTRFGMSFAILLVPCFLMGMTLPLLIRAVTDSNKLIGSRIGILYCLNTLGACLGCLAGGFWMVNSMSLGQMNFTGATVNFAIAVASIIISGPIARSTNTKDGENILAIEEPPTAGVLLLIIAFVNGLAGLACEVVWVRYLSFIMNSTYVFPTILCIYLLGMGLGGLIYWLLAGKIRRPAYVLGFAEVLLGLSVPAMFITSSLIYATGPPAPLGLSQMAFFTVLIPAILMGFAFPLLCSLYGRQVQTLGRRIGLLFAVNTTGTVLGSLLPVFVLIPLAGIQKSVIFISILYSVIGLALLWNNSQNRRLAQITDAIYVMSLIVLFVFVPSNLCQRVFLATNFDLARHNDILFYREGRTGTAIITRDTVCDRKTVYINGISEVPLLYPHQLCFKMIGDLAPMLQANPSDMLMICFGGGVAAGATSQIPDVKSLTIVDLECSIIRAAKLLSRENNDLLDNPKAQVVIDDGRNYIMMAKRKWPVIVSDSTHPKSGDSWVLYTQEFYRLVREHLTGDGVFVEWVPMDGLHCAEFKIIVRTFQSVFPHASLWVTQGVDEQGKFGAYALLTATQEELKIDVIKLRERLSGESVSRDLKPFGLDTPAGFLDTFLCGEEALRLWTGDGPINTDDLPYTQYETRYSKGPMFDNAELVLTMEDIWPYLTNTGNQEETARLKKDLAVRANVNRMALLGMPEKAYMELRDDVRYQQMLNIYNQSPRYIRVMIEIYKDNPDALNYYASLRMSGPNSFLDAAAIYDHVLKIDPKNITALNMLGAMALDVGKTKEAEEYLKRAVELSPDYTAARFNFGLLMEKTGRHSEALKQWEQCTVNCNDEKAADQWGMCLARQGKIDEAIKWFSRAVEIRPLYLDARLHLAIALHKSGRTKEALPHVRYVLKIDPQNKMVQAILAEMDGRGQPDSSSTNQ